MTYYKYVLENPLDFTHPFLTISQMKKMITQSFIKPRDYFLFGESPQDLIDDLDRQIMEVFPNGIDDSYLRMPILVFPIPTGEMWNQVKYCFIVKEEANGTTYICSPVRISLLEEDTDFVPIDSNIIK